MLCTNCNEAIRPVIGVDIDGTLGDWHTSFFNFAAAWLGIEESASKRLFTYDGSVDMATHMGLTKREYRQVKLAFRQGGMKRSMPLWPDARRLLCFLRDQGAEIWINTTRPYLQIGNLDDDTREWLRRNELPFDHLIYDDDKYAQLIEMVGLDRIAGVLEDQSEDWNRAYELGIDAVFRRTKWNHGAQPTTPYAVDTMEQAMAALTVRLRAWKDRNAAA